MKMLYSLAGNVKEMGQKEMSRTAREGIVTCGYGNRFVVHTDTADYTCGLRGRVSFVSDHTTPVAVGDDVLFTVTGENEGIIDSVQPRRSVLSRPAIGREKSEHVLAANIDCLIIVASIKSPALRTGLIDRFLIVAGIGGLRPAIVINKVDLGLDEEACEAIKVYQSLGYPLFLTSVTDGTGLEQLLEFLKNHRSILSGHSGVGKSSLLNEFLPGTNLRTSAVSRVTGKGRHATSHIQLFRLPGGGFIVDTPGIKVLGLWQLERDTLADHYPEIQRYLGQCRFTGCSHIGEPGCAVKEAVTAGSISSMRYQHYKQIYDSL